MAIRAVLHNETATVEPSAEATTASHCAARKLFARLADISRCSRDDVVFLCNQSFGGRLPTRQTGEPTDFFAVTDLGFATVSRDGSL